MASGGPGGQLSGKAEAQGLEPTSLASPGYSFPTDTTCRQKTAERVERALEPAQGQGQKPLRAHASSLWLQSLHPGSTLSLRDHKQAEQERRAERGRSSRSCTHTHLFKVVQAVLVTVGDVQGVEVLQGTPIIRKAHGGDTFQDLVQLLLARGLKANGHLG